MMTFTEAVLIPYDYMETFKQYIYTASSFPEVYK